MTYWRYYHLEVILLNNYKNYIISNETVETMSEVIVDGPFVEAINAKMSDKISLDSIQNIVSQSTNMMLNFPKPIHGSDCSRVGLMIGKVQSGKTSNFISIIAMAFDNGYDVAIVFGGVTNNLLSQSTERIYDMFGGKKEDLYIVNSNLLDDDSYRMIKRQSNQKKNYNYVS